MMDINFSTRYFDNNQRIIVDLRNKKLLVRHQDHMINYVQNDVKTFFDTYFKLLGKFEEFKEDKKLCQQIEDTLEKQMQIGQITNSEYFVRYEELEKIVDKKQYQYIGFFNKKIDSYDSSAFYRYNISQKEMTFNHSLNYYHNITKTNDGNFAFTKTNLKKGLYDLLSKIIPPPNTEKIKHPLASKFEVFKKYEFSQITDVVYKNDHIQLLVGVFAEI